MNSLNTRKHSTRGPNLRRGFFYALLILILGLSAVYPAKRTTLTPSIQGRTIDTQGQIVPYVSLVFTESQIFILSDLDGHFVYNAPLYAEDSIRINRIGFENLIMSASDLHHNNEIILSPSILAMEKVEVHGRARTSPTALTEMGRYTKTNGSGMMDHSKLLSRIPGVSIKAYGGPAGISTLSMDGGPSSHTKVLVDGIDITSAQNGETDLSQLPLPFIESMSYVPFDIGQTAGGATDGTIRLESGKPQNHMAFSGGSFGHAAYDINLKQNIMGLQTSIQVGQRVEAGNYPVVWSEEGQKRENNDLEQKFASVRLHGMLRPNLFLLLTALESRQSRGVAGLVWSPDLLSHRNDKLQILGSTLGWLRRNVNSQVQFSLRRSSENYSNPSLRLNSDHHLQSYRLEMNDTQNLTSFLSIISKMTINQDNIRSSAANQHSRNAYVASVAPIFKVLKEIKFIPGFKYHFSPDLYQKLLTDLQIQVPLGLGPLTKISVSRGEIYRYPSFNDQFWEPGGNPDLEPEETVVATAQMQLDLNRFGGLMLQWQQKESSNLIQWMPVHSYWAPANVLSAERESKKVIWNVEFPNWDLSGFAHLSLIKTIDHSIGKSLRYAPEQTSALGMTWTPGTFEFNLQFNYVAERISIYDYPEDTILDPSKLWSASWANTWTLKSGVLTLILTGDNLLNLDYETIRGYPEPGRSLKLNTRYTW